MFVRVDEIGRAEALDYEALTWQNDPQHPSTKYFLRQFVTAHYSRRFVAITEVSAVENLVLRVLARPEQPREAAADYDVVRRLKAREVGRERWTTNMQFVFRDVAPFTS